MPRFFKARWFALLVCAVSSHAQAEIKQKVVDIPTRPGVTQRMLLLTPGEPKATAILFAGGHGGLQIASDGSIKWGAGNFVVRTREKLAERGILVAVLDAPSDRQSTPFLSGFRQTDEHVEDIKITMAWLRQQAKVPLWLVGTSRGTQSAAYIATQLSGADGPDGIVLSSTILSDAKGRPVTAMALDQIRVPTLVIHHEQDGCGHCAYADLPTLMNKLINTPRKQLLSFSGGVTRGDPCEAMSYHGFNGLESDVVAQTAAWISAEQAP